MKISHNSLSRKIPFICLFLSGAATLVYELIWIKKLHLVFGGTLYAISAVLCAFMAGLALGSWGFAHALNLWTRRGMRIRLIRVYGVLEGLIGLYALFFPTGLEILSGLYPLALDLEAGPGLHVIEFLLSTLLMLPATLLMGATLPLIGSWAIGDRSHKVFSNMSVLYSINTFGAVFGCLYTQLFAIQTLGLRGATFTAVAMNALVFILCAFLEEEEDPKSREELPAFLRHVELHGDEADGSPPSKLLSYLILIIFVYSGMAALSSEILWTRVLVFPMGSTLYSFALILATFLFGIALGSLVAEKLLGNSRWILKFLMVELAIGTICIGILPLFDRLPEWTLQADRIFYDIENTPWKTLTIRSLFAFGLMFFPTLGFGLIFPLANHIHLNLFGSVGRTLGNSYAVNTLGAVLGAVLTPFLFIPLLGIRLTLFTLYAVLILLCFMGMGLYFRFRPQRLTLTLGIGLGLVYLGYASIDPRVSAEQLGRRNLARTEINLPKERIRLLDYKEGDYATLSVIEDTQTGARTLYVDGFSTATVSRSIGGSAYMQAMGFVPMALHPQPKKALVMCYGTGNTLGTVSLFPGVTVDGVEIDRNVLSMSHWFSEWNRNALDQPNVHIRIQDARTFIRWKTERYDVITLEPMSPVQAGVVHLYSREFYQQAADRLEPGGLMMQWLPLHLVSPDDAKSIIRTFQEAFPHTSVWNSFLTRIVLLVGSKEPLSLDKKRFDSLMEYTDLRKAAKQIGLNSFMDFLDFYITDGSRLKKFVQDAPIITDDRPLLEFSPATLVPPHLWETDQSFVNLLRHRVDRFPPVKGIDSLEEAELRRGYLMRTAQRFRVFSQRYEGPGKAAFAAKNYLAGLEAIRIDLEQRKDSPIRLRDARWR